MNEQRRLVINKLERENPRKNMHSSHYSARNDGAYSNKQPGDTFLMKNRPQTATGTNAVPYRNIKNAVSRKNIKESAEENGKLMNKLSSMNVIHRGSFPNSSLMEHNYDLASEKFGAHYLDHYVDINKKKVLNNWIKDELSNFEKRQDESLKNMEIQSKLHDSTTQLIDSSAAMVRTSAGGFNIRRNPESSKSSQTHFNKNYIVMDDQQRVSQLSQSKKANTTSTAMSMQRNYTRRGISGNKTGGA